METPHVVTCGETKWTLLAGFGRWWQEHGGRNDIPWHLVTASSMACK